MVGRHLRADQGDLWPATAYLQYFNNDHYIGSHYGIRLIYLKDRQKEAAGLGSSIHWFTPQNVCNSQDRAGSKAETECGSPVCVAGTAALGSPTCCPASHLSRKLGPKKRNWRPNGPSAPLSQQHPHFLLKSSLPLTYGPATLGTTPPSPPRPPCQVAA